MAMTLPNFYTGDASMDGSFYDVAAGAPWEYLYSSTPTSIFNLPNTLSPSLSFASESSVYSEDQADLLLAGDEFLQHINGCSPPVTMHPNLVCALKNMVSPGALTYNAQPCVLDRLEQLSQPMEQHHHVHENQHLRSAFLRQYPVVVPKLELPDLSPASIGAVVPCSITISGEPPKVAEKSETEESTVVTPEEEEEAAVVSEDLIKNRRPFRCQHEGCDKTFKNPQTMKMHHKTHYNDGSKPCTLPTLTSSLKPGHNKKTPSRCPKCKKTFVGLYELRRHFGRKHSEGEKPFGCRKCGKKFYIEVDVRDHEKLCGEPIECKCGLKFAFKCNLVAHKKAHPACQDNSHSHSTTTTTTSSSEDSVEQTSSRIVVGSKRAREESTSPGVQSSLHIPIPDFKGLPEPLPEFMQLTRREFPLLSFPPESAPHWASNMVYPTTSFTNLPYSNLGYAQHHHHHHHHKATYEAVNCETGIAFNQPPFKTWSG